MMTSSQLFIRESQMHIQSILGLQTNIKAETYAKIKIVHVPLMKCCATPKLGTGTSSDPLFRRIVIPTHCWRSIVGKY